MKVTFEVQTPIPNTGRVRQLESMFDVPRAEVSHLKWSGDVPIEGEDWRVGLIVGPSGSGKSTLAQHLWGKPRVMKWTGSSVVDDFAASLDMETIARVCQAVGFNTIPAWMRPHAVLSSGEKFRVDLARRLVEAVPGAPIVVDEFSSVVDRQVAKIGSHAVQKYVRKVAGVPQFVAVSCHYDIIDWLQPDWILEMPSMTFVRRSVQPRPALDVTIARVPYAAWHQFAPFHYLTASLNPAARCFGLWVGDRLASFSATLTRPHPVAKDIIGVSRGVTLPDWQGLGLTFVMNDVLGSAFKAIGKRMHLYPAHPAVILSCDRSPRYAMVKAPGFLSYKRGPKSTVAGIGARPCATFLYVGPAMEAPEASVRAFLAGSTGAKITYTNPGGSP